MLKDKNGAALERRALAYCLGLESLEPEMQTEEVQIIVRYGRVEAIHNWPEGLSGAVYNYDNATYDNPAAEARCPVEELIKDGDTNSHVLVNTRAFDWLVAKAMKRAKGEN